jgi:uncharacterized protein (DUF169 family)
MDTQFTEFFLSRWKKYFADVELPICYFYTDTVREEDKKETRNEHRCLIANLNRVRNGFSFVYDANTPGCPGGKRYSGFSQELRPKFEYFLSCGIPGEIVGERYKKSPDLVKEYLQKYPAFEAPAKYLVFKRLDKLVKKEQPVGVIFFAPPDVLSGLFTLANYDMADANGVIAPMGAGCSSIMYYPNIEANAENPRCVLGMFDVSARPCVPENKLTFAIPMRRFEQMVLNMDESFLITESWNLVRNRLHKSTEANGG